MPHPWHLNLNWMPWTAGGEEIFESAKFGGFLPLWDNPNVCDNFWDGHTF
jgi:hypothetical protein